MSTRVRDGSDHSYFISHISSRILPHAFCTNCEDEELGVGDVELLAFVKTRSLTYRNEHDQI